MAINPHIGTTMEELHKEIGVLKDAKKQQREEIKARDTIIKTLEVDLENEKAIRKKQREEINRLKDGTHSKFKEFETTIAKRDGVIEYLERKSNDRY